MISFVFLISHDICIEKSLSLSLSLSLCPSRRNSAPILPIFIFPRAVSLRHRFLIERGSQHRHVEGRFPTTRRTWRSITIAADSPRLKSLGTSFSSLLRTMPPREVYYTPRSRLTRGCARAQRTCLAMITFVENRDKRIENNKRRNPEPDR